MTVVFVWAGALAAWPGWLGLAITLVSWAALAALPRGGARQAEAVVEQALVDALGADYRDAILPAVREQLAPRVDWRQILLPFPMRHAEVERVRDVEYCRPGDARALSSTSTAAATGRRAARRCSRSTAAAGWSAARTSRASRSCCTSRRAAGCASASTTG